MIKNAGIIFSYATFLLVVRLYIREVRKREFKIRKVKQIFQTMTVKLNANEVVLKAGDTNQVINNNTIEGKLIVTNQRIYFKTLNEDTEKFNLEILFENILEVIFYSKGIFSVKGLSVVTRDGKSHSFPLKKRDEIGQLINKMY
jgi:hypothetical protein